MRRRALTAAVVAGLAGLAWAQPGGPGGKPADAPLAGPKVESTEVVEGRNRFGGEANAPGAMRDRPLGVQALERALRSFGEAPAELRLSDEQHEQIRAAMQEHRAAVRAYMQEHREELAALRKTAGENARERWAGRDGEAGRPMPGGQGGRGDVRRDRARDGEGAPPPPPEDAMGGPGMDGPDGMDGPPRGRAGGERPEATPAQQEAREKLRALMAGGPPVGELQKKIAAVLTEPQKAHLEEQLQLIRTEGQRRAMERLAPGGAGAGAGRGEGEMTREQLRERLESLPPEQRERLREEMRQRRGANADRRERERARDDGAPPPPRMDEVDVPSPDDE